MNLEEQYNRPTISRQEAEDIIRRVRGGENVAVSMEDFADVIKPLMKNFHITMRENVVFLGQNLSPLRNPYTCDNPIEQLACYKHYLLFTPSLRKSVKGWTHKLLVENYFTLGHGQYLIDEII